MKTAQYLFFFSFCFFALFAFIFWRQRHEQDLNVFFLDVGQGDGAYLRTPSADDIVIDAGPDLKILSSLGAQMPFYDHAIELFVLTHPDQDHIMGAVELLRRYDVKRVLWTGRTGSTAVYRAWAEELQKEGSEVLIGRAGDVFSFGETELVVLFPFDDATVRDTAEANDTSLLLSVRFGESAALFTGDASEVVEKEILKRFSSILSSDILKVGHHGSRFSTRADFLQAVNPAFAVIEVGKENRYGHPHPEVLVRLADAGASVLRTDILGTVHFRCSVQECVWVR